MPKESDPTRDTSEPPLRMQGDTTCGPVTLTMLYRDFNIPTTEQSIVNEMQMPYEGASWKMMMDNLDQHEFISVFHDNSSWDQLINCSYMRHPIIVCWFKEGGETPPAAHYSLLKHVNNKYIDIWDPADGEVSRYDRSYFEPHWHDEETSKAFLMAITKKKVRRII